MTPGKTLLWLLVPVSLLQSVVVAETKGDKVPRQIQALADQAVGVPPEFSADILLKLASHPGVHDKGWKIQAIEDAFAVAANAQNPYVRIGGKHTDTLEARQAWDHGFDVLSLQCRAVDNMLNLDSTRARDLFERITFPQLPLLKCRESLVPEISGYYKTFSRVLNEAFNNSERAKGRDIEAIESQIRMVHSPAQIAPLARVILIAPVSLPQRQQLLSALAATMPRLSTSDRQFEASEFDLSKLQYDLLRNAQAVLSNWIPAFRELLVRQYAQPRCSDRPLSPDGIPKAAVEFNALLDKLKREQVLVAETVGPITKDEVRPSEVAESIQVTEFWQSADARMILNALKWLSHGNRDLPDAERFWSDSERASTEWGTKRIELLKLLDDWHEGVEDAVSLYHMKAEAYAEIAQLTPEGKARDNAFALFLSFLDQYYDRVENRSGWFTEFAVFQERMRSRKEESKLIDPMKRSADPVIPLYAGWLEVAPAEGQR